MTEYIHKACCDAGNMDLCNSRNGPVYAKRQREMHILPCKHPHVDDALMNHLILKGVRRCSCLKVGLDKNKKENTLHN